jgi:hypothetical protein
LTGSPTGSPKPIVYVYVSRAILGTRANVQSVFNTIHNTAVTNGFPSGLYIVADQVFGVPTAADYDKLKDIRASATTAFNLVYPPPSQGFTMPAWRDTLATRYTQAANGLEDRMTLGLNGLTDIQPGIFVQYDDRGLNIPPPVCMGRPVVVNYWLSNGSEWSSVIQTAGLNQRRIARQVAILSSCAERYTTNSSYTSIVWTYSYNEWGEGAGIEELVLKPTRYPFGFGTEPLSLLKQKLP